MSKTLPKFEDYKAPWEVDSTGNPIPEDEQQLDPALLKKKLYDVLSDRSRLVGERDGLNTELGQVKSELDTLRRKDEGAEEKAKREAQEAIDAARDAAKKEGALEALKLEVALDIEGITPAQAKRLAKRLSGSTQEELEADAKAVAEDFGIGKTAASDDDNEPPAPVGRPRRVSASGDPDPTATPTDTTKIDELFPRR